MSDFRTVDEIVAELHKKMKDNQHDHIMKSCHDTCNDLCHESIHSLTCHDSKRETKKVIEAKPEAKLSKNDWWYLVNQLEQWRVFNPRAIITKYGPFNAWEAMIRTKENSPRVPGAYFTKVVRSLAA